MEIKLETLNQSKFGHFPLLDRTRLATATSVKFIDKNHFLTSSFVGCRLYYIYFDESKYEIKDKIDTKIGDKFVCTDLVEHRNGIISLSVLEENSVLIYKLENNKLSFIKSIKIPRRGKCHGVCFTPTDSNIIVATSNYYENYISYIDIEKGEILSYVDYPYKIQDVQYYNNNMILVGTNCNPSRNIKDMTSYIIINTSAYEYKGVRFDGVTIYNDKIYVADQYNDNITVLRMDGKIEKYIGGMLFPHDVDILDGVMAVSNYGTNSIKIIYL